MRNLLPKQILCAIKARVELTLSTSADRRRLPHTGYTMFRLPLPPGRHGASAVPFETVARDGVELEKLAALLLDVVNATMQPPTVQL